MIMAETKSKHIYTVSKLTREIKSLIEEMYPFVWVTGEISNYALPASGHSYFTLKDQRAVISCVMFKNQRRRLKFKPENGMKIIGMARLSLYEPRGSYQLIFEHLEPEGAGSMQIAFEQLKRKLSDQGFFDDTHKKPIPFFPLKISVITSGTGAALRDIINVAQRRFQNCCLEILPVNVQGHGAENEICEAINLVNQRLGSDLIILARGGGSLEDLAPFNTETVARAIFKSDIPIISGVGHETDFTVADFVADLRAPTPSAAAELALPDKGLLVQKISGLQESLNKSLQKKCLALNQTIVHLRARLKSPKTVVYDFRFRLEDYESRLNNTMTQCLHYNREKFHWLSDALHDKNPDKRISDLRQQVKTLFNELTFHFQKKIQHIKTNYLEQSSKLYALNPKAVLKRGYSISRFVSDKRVITQSSNVKKNDQIEVILFKGRLITRVEKSNG
jgi:exodeoxyribonuclease VII large subunit